MLVSHIISAFFAKPPASLQLCANHLRLVLQWLFEPRRRYACFPNLGLSAAERQEVIDWGSLVRRGTLLSLRGDMKITRWSEYVRRAEVQAMAEEDVDAGSLRLANA